jgi:hypothetical protein
MTSEAVAPHPLKIPIIVIIILISDITLRPVIEN